MVLALKSIIRISRLQHCSESESKEKHKSLKFGKNNPGRPGEENFAQPRTGNKQLFKDSLTV